MSTIQDSFVKICSEAAGILLEPINKKRNAKAETKVRNIELGKEFLSKLYADILNSPEIAPADKYEFAIWLNKGKRESRNIKKIIDMALNNLSPDANLENLDDDWLALFFDRAKLINDEQIRPLWASVLTEATVSKNLCSKTLINTLTLISFEQAQDFANLCRFCLDEFSGNTSASDRMNRVNAYPFIYYSEYPDRYAQNRITRMRLSELSHLGLIEVNFDQDQKFVFKKSMRLIYGNQVVTLNSDANIEVGNVLLTFDGYLLYRIVERNYNYAILDFNKEIWKTKGYEVYIDGKSSGQPVL